MSAGRNARESDATLREIEAAGLAFQRVECPQSESELQQILERASRERLKVLAVGGGTALGVGVLPEKVDLVVDMRRLAKLVSFDAKNLNTTVQAGMTVDAINEHLAGEGGGFFLPLDPPLSHRATIGGVYAANLSGPSRLLYGTLRDQALGVRAVDARGRPLKFGGVTVKNVSGYDLTKFLIGSAGSLCLVTSISLRVYPVPEAAALSELALEDEENLQCLLRELRSSVLVPTAVVVTVGEVDRGFRLLVAFEGHLQAVERQIGDLGRMSERHGARGKDQAGRDSMNRGLRAAVNPDGLAGHVLTLKVSVPIGQGPTALGAARRQAEAQGLDTKLALLAGNGVLFAHASADEEGALGGWVEGVKETAARLSGHTLPLQAPRAILSAWGSRLDPTLARCLFLPIKQKLDPDGVLLAVA